MSFKKEDSSLDEKRLVQEMLKSFLSILFEITKGASINPSANVNVMLYNSKKIPNGLERKYSCVITSPPYANRISYVREVRPYMYWLGFFDNSKQAGDLEWDATGGTWGSATSRLSTWTSSGLFASDSDFIETIEQINLKSPILANYVHRYFEDMHSHFSGLHMILKPNAKLHYIIGNSKFYDVIVPSEELYANMLRENGFTDVKIEMLRQRSSKKELFEYLVSATWNG